MDIFCKALQGLEFHPEIEQAYFAFLRDGAIVFEEQYNVSEKKVSRFEFDIIPLMEAIEKEGFLGVAHTHPEGYEFSVPDFVFAKAWQVPIFVICAKTKNFDIHFPCEYTYEKFPLIGRQYILGYTDCNSLVRDYYFINYKINLERFGRKMDWRLEELNLEGLDKIPASEEMKEGDILVFGVKGGFLHCGIYTGDGKLLHHDDNKISCEETIPPVLRRTHVFSFRKNG